MAATLTHERDNIYRLDLSGALQHDELTAVQRQLAAVIERTGPVRALIMLTDFTGWGDSAGWRDLRFYVRYGDAIDRIAIVGDERWREQALMFAGADLRRGLV